MKANASDGAWALRETVNDVGRRSPRDPATAMAQGIVLGAVGGVGLWALVGAAVVSIF